MPPPAALTPAWITALALAKGVRDQLGREWRGTPFHRWSLIRPRPEGFAAQPRNLRPVDVAAGRAMLAGAFTFGGSTLDTGSRGDPWDRPSPSLRFAIALHRLDWMGDLLAVGEDGVAEGLRLTLDWSRVFGRWNAFSWSHEVLDRRVFNLACAVKTLAAKASDAEAALMAFDLARQARHLLATLERPHRAAEQACAAAVAGAALAGEAGEKLMAQALVRLDRALPTTVAPDGGHASRSPMAALELLFDLLALDDALVQRGAAAPDEMMRAIDRLAGAVRFFTLADGALPAFQGGEEGRAAYVSAARASEDSAPRPAPATRNGYHRLEGKTLQVVVDSAPPAQGPWSLGACGQPLALEVVAGKTRLIVNTGWSLDAAGPQALREIAAASTLSVGDHPIGEPLKGLRAAALGPRLIGADYPVEARRQTGEHALWLELAHDGWARRYGLRHERRLFLDLNADELRGEDKLIPMGSAAAATAVRTDGRRRFVPFAIRFHIHPNVRASLARDGRSVLLKADGEDMGWWLRNDAREVAVESSVHFRDGRPRRAQQVVLRGQASADGGAKVRWKLAAADLWPPPR